ncbi:MAG: sigma-70 family RNA polymerase sigma factor [Candidatus Daviesbacteria bacterium]
MIETLNVTDLNDGQETVWDLNNLNPTDQDILDEEAIETAELDKDNQAEYLGTDVGILYNNSINDISVYTPEEEQAKFRDIAEQKKIIQEQLNEGHPDFTIIAAAQKKKKEDEDEILIHNLRLVRAKASKYAGKGVAVEDLIQEGNIILYTAIDKFDYTKGYKFSTYATFWIKQIIIRCIAYHGRTIRIPVHAIEELNKIHKLQNRVLAETGENLSIEQIANKTGSTPEKVNALLEASQKLASFSQPVRRNDDTELGDLIADEVAENSDQSVNFYDNKEKAESLLEDTPLTERERRVIELRFGFDGQGGKTLEEIGKIMNGVSRERIRQVEKNALIKLRASEK